MNGGAGLRTGQVAELAGVNAQTLRYYQRRGLVAEPARSPGGHRIYPPETVTLLRVIKAAQRLGFTLAEVAELLDAGRHGHHTRSGLHQRAVAKLAELHTGLADLTAIRATLAEVVAAGCDDLTYYGGGQRVCPLRRLTCTDAKIASPHLIAPVITAPARIARCRSPSSPASPMPLGGAAGARRTVAGGR